MSTSVDGSRRPRSDRATRLFAVLVSGVLVTAACADDDETGPTADVLTTTPHGGESAGRSTTTSATTATAESPTTSTSRPTTGEGPVAVRDVEWDAVDYPLECDEAGATALADLLVEPEPGHELVVVLAACRAGAGTPPRSVLVYGGGDSTTTPGLVQTLWEDGRLRLTGTITASGATVVATGHTYSSRDVPRCCPDGTFTTTWTWAGDRYEETSSDAPPYEGW